MGKKENGKQNQYKEGNGKQNPYEEIIRQPYRKSRRHPWMSDRERAAQFAPFAALEGFDSLDKENTT